MQSEIWVASNSSVPLLRNGIGIDCPLVLVNKPPNRIPKVFRGKVFALGGGSVIDYAKMLAGDNPCYVCPTTASGAAMTSHAVIWTKKEKKDIKTPRPILMSDYKTIPIVLRETTIHRTMFDCGCHIIESRYSTKATKDSLKYCDLAEFQFMKYLVSGRIVNLIEAGNLAGMAIEITGTNYFHAISYVLTLEYGLCHGDALREAWNIKRHKDYQKIIKKASQYKKFHESTLL